MIRENYVRMYIIIIICKCKFIINYINYKIIVWKTDYTHIVYVHILLYYNYLKIINTLIICVFKSTYYTTVFIQKNDDKYVK